MAKLLSENKVLKKLDIVDFRHLTKNKVIAMASMLDKMDPEVAKKALEQFPEFSATTKEIMKEFKDTIDKGLEANRESVQTFYTSCASIIEALQKQLENENLSFEERKYVIEKMVEVSNTIGEKDSENKKFILVMTSFAAIALGVVVSVLATAIGGNTKIEDNDEDNFIE